MTKKEFTKEVNNIFASVRMELNGVKLESVGNWFGTPFKSPFQYGATSEYYMEKQLREVSGRERKTTFMSDLSLGEWYGLRGLFDTIKNAMTSWCNDVEYMAEFILCVNWKSWEHDARNNGGWTKLYVSLFEKVRDLMYRYYENDEEKTQYLYEYLD